MYLFGAKCISRVDEVMYFFKLSVYPKEKTQRVEDVSLPILMGVYMSSALTCKTKFVI